MAKNNKIFKSYNYLFIYKERSKQISKKDKKWFNKMECNISRFWYGIVRCAKRSLIRKKIVTCAVYIYTYRYLCCNRFNGKLGFVNLEPVIINNFDDQQHHQTIGAPCLTTVDSAVQPPTQSQPHQPPPSSSTSSSTLHGETILHQPQLLGSNNIHHNSALAMSQLGTVYATKRRRRNGKRLVFHLIFKC